MKTRTAISMRASPMTIYRLAAAVERWPELLPHYRWVTLLERNGNRKLVEMAATRDGFPVKWTALQELDPDTPAIRFRHVQGLTTGMEVEWRFERQGEETLVAIHHHLELRWPLIGRWAAESVIGPHFIDNIAGKTLRRMKALAEAEERASSAGEGRPGAARA